MTPRYVPGERFTAEQAKLVAEQAGLDPDRPISEQLDQQPAGLEQQVAQLTTRVEQLTQQLATPAEPESEDFTTRYAKALGGAQSEWFDAKGDRSDAA